MNMQQSVTTMKYGDRWRLTRRIYHQEFNLNSVTQYKGLQMKYAKSVLFARLNTTGH